MSAASLNEPSALYRQQIKNIAARMCKILDQTASVSPERRDGLNNIEAQFKKTTSDAHQYCSALDAARSVTSEDQAITAIHVLMTTLVDIKNETDTLAHDFHIKDMDLLIRFQNKLDTVEQLMNASMRPLMNNSLTDKGGRQALETLERWSELYRHGLEATANIPARGEKWLLEAHMRLDLTAQALRQLDIMNEAIATKNRKRENMD